MANELKTLQEAIVYFSDPDRCREYFVARRWPEGVSCPNCGSVNVKFQPKHNRWQCSSHHAQRQFTCKTGTIFEDSPITLDKWMLAMWMVCNCKNGVSSYEIHRAIGVTQKSAWFMLHRLRLALQTGSLVKLGGKSGEVEADETFIGGKARNKELALSAARASAPFAEYIGAAQGIIHSWYKEASPTPFFYLREASSDALIKCYYGDELYKEIALATARRNQIIHVHGQIRADAIRKTIEEMQVDKIIRSEAYSMDDVRRFLHPGASA